MSVLELALWGSFSNLLPKLLPSLTHGILHTPLFFMWEHNKPFTCPGSHITYGEVSIQRESITGSDTASQSTVCLWEDVRMVRWMNGMGERVKGNVELGGMGGAEERIKGWWKVWQERMRVRRKSEGEMVRGVGRGGTEGAMGEWHRKL